MISKQVSHSNEDLADCNLHNRGICGLTHITHNSGCCIGADGAAGMEMPIPANTSPQVGSATYKLHH